MVKVCSAILYVLCIYKAQISGERLQDHWSSGSKYSLENCFYELACKLRIMFLTECDIILVD